MFTESIAKGFSIGIPRLLRAGDNDDVLVYIEMVGPRANVRANWAALKGGGKRPRIDGHTLNLKAKEHVIVKADLPSGWDHWAMLHKQASIEEMDPTDPFFLLNWQYDGGSYRNQPMPPNFLPMLDKAIPLPLRPEWAEYLWKAGEEWRPGGRLIAHLGYFSIHMSGWHVNNDAEKWEEIIREGFDAGALSF